MASHKSYISGIVYHPTVINAVTVTTTSAAQLVAGARGVGIEFYSTAVDGIQDRAGNIKITVSMDGGTTFRDYNMLIDNVVNTNAQNLTRIASKGLTAGSAQNAVLWMTPETLSGITHIKAVFTRTTEGTAGTFACNLVITY